jgi:Mlc titration factor MtfA (ptsG expression regulator)
MIFGWLRRRRRKKILEQPFPAEWLRIVDANVWQYATLSPDEQARLCAAVQVFVAEKNFEGCGGLVLSDEIRVTIAAYACLLTLELHPDSYDHVFSILVYPEDYYAPETTVTKDGLMRDKMSNRAGEAWEGGSVVLSWADVLRDEGDRRTGYNVVIHEFAHQLDMLNAAVDGTPPLGDTREIARWRKIMTAEYNLLVRQVEQKRRTFLDRYGAKDMAELFAIATESFFERPVEMRRREPILYTLLREYYRQDPAARAH